MRTSLAVVLAAGEGKRMKSALPKVLHPIGGLPMIAHVLNALGAAAIDRIAVVIAPGHDERRESRHGRTRPGATVHIQAKPLGHGRCRAGGARAALEAKADDILVVFGDTPFISSDTVATACAALLADGAAVVVGGMVPADPDRLWPPVMRRRPARRDPRRARRERGGARHPLRATAASWRSPAASRSPFSTRSATTTPSANST